MRYSCCPFNAIYCGACDKSIGTRNRSLTIRKLIGKHEKAKHPNNKLSTQHMDAAAALITSILTRVATAQASLRTNDEQRTLLQLFLPENFILGYYCTACENHFKSRNYCRIDAHKEFRQSVSAFPSIVFLNNPSKSVRIPVDFDPNDEALLSVPYWKLLVAERQ